jgi:hypothetical protein
MFTKWGHDVSILMLIDDIGNLAPITTQLI